MTRRFNIPDYCSNCICKRCTAMSQKIQSQKFDDREITRQTSKIKHHISKYWIDSTNRDSDMYE